MSCKIFSSSWLIGAVCLVLFCSIGLDNASASILISEGFDSYTLGTHTSVDGPPNPGDFPTLDGPSGWGTPYRSHIGAGLTIDIAAGPSGGLFDGPSTTGNATSWWRDRMMDPDIHSNTDGTVTWQAMKVSTAGSGGGAFRVNNSNGGMQYKVLLDGSNQYELRGGHIDTVSSASTLAASTNINQPDFVLTKIENIAGGQSTASTWINPDLSGGESGLGAAPISVTYSPFAGNRNLGEIVLQPGPNIRLDNIVFADAFADALPIYTWSDPTTGGTWENNANWTGPPGIPNAQADTAIFPQLPATNSDTGSNEVSVTVTGGKTLQALLFTGPDRVNLQRTAYSISGDTLTFADGGQISHETFHTWQVAHQRIDNDIVMQGDLDINMNWDTSNVCHFNLYGTITGNGTLTLDNTHKPAGGAATGRLHLRGNSASTFTGETVINGGSVMLYAGSLGDTTGKTTINSGSVMGATAEDFIINGPAMFQSYGGNRVYSGDVLVNATGSLVLDPGGNALTVSGDIRGPGGVSTLSGHPTDTVTGHVWLKGNNTFDGTLSMAEKAINGGGTFVTLDGSMAHSDILVGSGVTFDGTSLIAFTDDDIIHVAGTMDAENMQFDLTGLTGTSATLVDYTAGAFNLGSLALLDNLMTSASSASGWSLLDTGSLIRANIGVGEPVPEPSTLLLAALGLFGLLIGFRRKSRLPSPTL